MPHQQMIFRYMVFQTETEKQLLLYPVLLCHHGGNSRSDQSNYFTPLDTGYQGSFSTQSAILNRPILPPDVITSQIDVLPAKRQQILQQSVIDGFAGLAQRLCCTVEIGGVPQNDGGCHQIEAAGAITLPPETAVADFAQPVEEYSPGQRVRRLTLVQPIMDSATQRNILQPVQNKNRARDPPQFAQRNRQAILERGAAEFP